MTPASERGAGSVLVVGVVAVTLLLGAGVGVLAAAQRARAVAQTAADLGALAAAASVTVPQGVVMATPPSAGVDPCALAAEAVARNGAVLESCGVRPDGVAEVTASRRTGPGVAVARARAGPSGGAPHR